MIKPILSIIIISFNTSKITVDCLRSVLADKGLDFEDDPKGEAAPAEIIIIDNNSQDSSVKDIKNLFLKKKIPQSRYKIIVNKENSGFGKANNQGFRFAQGNYILMLNSDTIILHSAISQSLTWLSSHPEAMACTAQLLNKDGTIQASGGYFPNLLNMFTWATGLDDLPFVNSLIKPFHPHTPDFYTKDSFFTIDHRQDWITGAYILIRKSALDKVDGFDENYFMYGEEYELLYRLTKANSCKEIWYLVGPQTIHLGGASSATRTAPIIREIEGALAFFKKHKPSWQYQLVKIMLKLNPSIRLRALFLQTDYYKKLCSEI